MENVNVLKVKKLGPDATLPIRAYQGDAALDLYSAENLSVSANGSVMVKTKIALEIPHGYVGLVWDRSGLAAKSGITTMGGVIDSNYRGEVMVILHNTKSENFEVKAGDRIAQLLIQKIESPEIVEVQELEESVRGDKAFGSSGI
jgi:dUTP pyrophosphatase